MATAGRTNIGPWRVARGSLPAMSSSPLSQPLPWDLVAAAYAQDTAPVFESYANRALDLAGLGASARVLDVAAGPGTLSLLAAARGHQVQALDFAPNMIEALKQRAAAKGVSIAAQTGDGMALPYGAESFDAAFSMFGLMFFPDRAKGFAELHRVLVPGGRAAVSSWHPLDGVPIMRTAFTAMSELLGQPAGPPPVRPALTTEADCVAEMSAAGFRDVSVVTHVHGFSAPSLTAFWQSFPKACAPMALLRNSMGNSFDAIEDGMLQRLRAEFGDGPVTLDMPAWITVGTR